MADEHTILEQLKQAVMHGDEETVVALAEAALAAGVEPQKAILEGLTAGMIEMGCLYEEGECYIPELMVSSDALHAGLTVLQPLATASGTARRKGIAVIGAVQGDIHDIGKNLVKMMLEVNGIEVRDLGHGVQMEKFVEAVQETDADLLCLSALMTTTMTAIKDHMPEFKTKLPNTKIMVGGALLDKRLADEWGADGYGDNAVEAARVALRLLGEQHHVV